VETGAVAQWQKEGRTGKCEKGIEVKINPQKIINPQRDKLIAQQLMRRSQGTATQTIGKYSLRAPRGSRRMSRSI
jgi:hypothetical protein